MASLLSKRDTSVLEKIKDPESDPTRAAFIDPTLPRDPWIKDEDLYERVCRSERKIVLRLQELESQIAVAKRGAAAQLLRDYQDCVDAIGKLISAYPDYASVRNNRAQAMRRLYGDEMLVETASGTSHGLLQNVEVKSYSDASMMVLEDLDKSISLLTPPGLFAAISPTASKTLSMAHTQRAAIYHATSRALASGRLRDTLRRKEMGWKSADFDEAASRDFALGGRYGNEIAKGLAVSSNPTAKLCGQMVQEMMKKEYGTGLE
jgi:hypothetical protein